MNDDRPTGDIPDDIPADLPQPSPIERLVARLPRVRLVPLAACAAAVAAAWGLWTHMPLRNVPNGELGVRLNRLTGDGSVVRAGTVFVFPGLQDLRLYDLREQVWRADQSASASGPAPFQSVEGLSIGVDVTAHYALDPARIGAIARDLPANLAGDVVAPAVQGVIYRVFTRYTVREIFSSKRAEIQQVIESELRPKLAANGIVLRDVQIGKVDLPPDYKRGMEALLAEELASDKMRFTLELKEKEVKQAGLEAEAEKVKREKAAEAAGVGSRADLATATQAVAKAGAAVSFARATAEERATRLAQLQAHLSEMTLVSPIAGSVALMYAQDGARVEEGHPVLRVISGDVFVKFAIPADKAGSVRPGDLVDLRLDRRPDLLTARVGHIAPELDAVAQMVIADADLIEPPPDLKPGTVGRILPRPARPAAARPTK